FVSFLSCRTWSLHDNTNLASNKRTALKFWTNTKIVEMFLLKDSAVLKAAMKRKGLWRQIQSSFTRCCAAKRALKSSEVKTVFLVTISLALLLSFLTDQYRKKKEGGETIFF
ncbi:unnamed protein product, partial [Larinioides sclopetarius]